MNKKIRRKFGLIFLIIFGTVLVVLGYKWISGTHIRHYQQYIFPCQGRISTYANSPAKISFYVLDEETISELSDQQNILRINLIEENDNVVSADDWGVSDNAGFYSESKYSAKELSVTLTLERVVVVKKLEIVYADKTESFDIGSLTIEPMENSEFEASTQIISYPMGVTSQNKFLNNDTDFFVDDKTLLQISANTLAGGYRITKIEFGIPGLGINPSTLKVIPENMDFGKTFTEDLTNETYFSALVTEQMPDQEISLEVENMDGEFTNAIIGLVKSQQYDEAPMAIYYSPVFACVDNETNAEYRYSNPNYIISAPTITSDDYAQRLLEEQGK